MTLIRVLITGDCHIGRVSTRIPSDRAPDLSTTAAWQRIVETAIAEGVDLVCATGDLADESNRYFQAVGPLERGVRQLEQHGIPLLAVSGNHDYEVLPRLADTIAGSGFRLLGRGGEWERFTLTKDCRDLLHVDGWSFPRRDVKTSPIDSYQPEKATLPVLAMVHGDLDQPTSRYAPLSRAALRNAPIVGWMLGHVHAPLHEEHPDLPFVVYPGSPQALDPGEPGMHGATIATIEHGQCTELRRVPISTVRYDQLSLDLSGVGTLEDATYRLQRAIERELHDAADEGGPHLKTLSLRVELTGSTSIGGELADAAGRIRNDLDIESAGVSCVIEQLTTLLRPAVDLDALAQTESPVGIVASVIAELKQADTSKPLSGRTKRAIKCVEKALDSTRADTSFSALPESDEADARTELVAQAERLLFELLDQTAPRSETP